VDAATLGLARSARLPSQGAWYDSAVRGKSLAIVLVGLAAAAGSVSLAFMLGFVLGYECGGGEGSGGVDSEAWICRGPLEYFPMFGGLAIALAAPVLGMGYALKSSRWGPLWTGCVLAAMNLVILYVLMWEA
jgi:hypothetical protein